MTDATKLIIAITAGLIGLALAIFATIVAINARDTANNEASVQQLVTQEVEQRLDQAIAEQARKESRQVSVAEKFVRSLVKGERKTIREYVRLKRSVRRLKADLEATAVAQKDGFSRLDRRIDNTNEDLAAISNRVRRVRDNREFNGGANP
ncbi:MAG: hypothetical protein ACO3CR_07805 [Solirubrobacterales bacterium]